jgi:tetratricopeptide (TPR) repeat protein
MADPTADVTDGIGADRAGSDDERWHLNDQMEFLHRSIADAEAEHEAGDLSDEDYALLVARDRRKLVEVEHELGQLAPVAAVARVATSAVDADAPAAPAPASAKEPKMARWRLVGILASCALIIIGVVILVDHALSPRATGQATSGSVTQTQQQLIEEQLAQASTLNNEGQVSQALSLYGKVLAEDPTDPDALANSGWLQWNQGASDHSTSLEYLGRESEEAAIRESPRFYGGHLFLGLIELYQDNKPKVAVVQFDEFLADDPPAAQVKLAASKLKAAYKAAGLAVPAALNSPSG